MAKRVYKKSFKEAMQNMMDMTKDEIIARLQQDSCTNAERLAGAHILKDMNYLEEKTSPQEGTFIAKLTGDMTEEVSVNVNQFTELVKKISSEDGSEW